MLAVDGEVNHVVHASLRGRPLGYFDARSLEPTVHELTEWLAPGDKISFHAMTLPESGPVNFPTANGVRDYEGPGIAFDWFEVEGPLDETWPPPSERRLLGIPRLPPPPNIPAIEPDATGATTIRQMVEMHRADNACAVCHARINPYGLALEAFDPIGGHRDRYRLSGRPKKVKQGKEKVMEPSVEVVSFTASANRNRIQVGVGSEVDCIIAA